MSNASLSNLNLENEKAEHPPVYRSPSFWGMTSTQFLGAFNDNVFKQLVLLLALSVSAKDDWQGIATIIFATPFILFSGFAGFLSERFSKTHIIVASKVAEIVVMALGVIAFYFYTSLGIYGAFVVLFLMGTQSAFFGPAKYGILPEFIEEDDLPKANGFFLMTTFVAIILGVASAGFFKSYGGDKLWITSFVCVGIAIAGTITTKFIRKLPPALPTLKLESSTFWIPPDMRELISGNRRLLEAIGVASLFWLLGGLVQPSVNTLGIKQLMMQEKHVGILQACMAIGIATGCITAGTFCKNKNDMRLVHVGAWGIVFCLLFLGLPAFAGIGDMEHSHLLDINSTGVALVFLGFFAGVLVVPIQVLLQTLPPPGKKGRMIAVVNVCTWVGIFLSGALYHVGMMLIDFARWPKATIFLFAIVVMLPVALFYRPEADARESSV